jgi:non-canonical (house-cleaning) NTP pyrophosphatase
MKILLGTTSEQKINILKDYLNRHGKYELFPIEVQSEVPEQPIGLETTILGATNRARNSIKEKGPLINNDIAIGMEAGFVLKDDIYHLVCVVVIIDSENKIHTGVSSLMPVPKEVSDAISKGHRFGEAIRAFELNLSKTADQELINRTSDLIDRKALFREALDEVRGF